MNDVKSALQSKTVWGALITIVAPLLGLLGITLSADDQAFLIDSSIGTVNLISTAATLIGGFYALISRLRSNKRIGGVFVAQPSKAPTPSLPS